MPKIHDEKKKVIEPKAAAAQSKTKLPGAAAKKPGFATQSAALKPKAKTAERKTATPQVPKLSTFSSCKQPLTEAIGAALAIKSGNAGAIATLSRALESIRSSVVSTTEAAEYSQKGDLATRLDLSAEEKNRLGNKAEEDLAEVEAIFETVETISEMMTASPDASLALDRTLEVLAEARADIGSLGRTFASEGFILLGGSPAKDPAATPPPAAETPKVVAPKPPPVAAKKPILPKAPKPATAAKVAAPA